ncbi:ABC transporter ATP-binding protein [Streptomyces mayteni]
MTARQANPASVELRGVSRHFGDHRVLSDVRLTLAAGETVALLGASGSGKSTVLRLIAGLDRPSAGEVLVDGVPVRRTHPRAAVVFQDPRLLSWRGLAANVAFGLPPGTPRAGRAAEVAHWLEVVGLADYAGHRPSQVSGGMAGRAALARALARRPGVLLLDEPFAALDALTRLRMQDLLDDVQRTSGTTVLLVTHDVDEALRLADRIVLLGDRPASVVATLDVPTPRPRAHDDPTLPPLRGELLRRLGVPDHRSTSQKALR